MALVFVMAICGTSVRAANFAIFTAKESYQTVVSDGDIGFDWVGRGARWLGKKAVASDSWPVARNSYETFEFPHRL